MKFYVLSYLHSLKKEVEERLIKLSEDFQTIMQLKIGTTTKITVAENNALKKEVSTIIYFEWYEKRYLPTYIFNSTNIRRKSLEKPKGLFSPFHILLELAEV